MARHASVLAGGTGNLIGELVSEGDDVATFGGCGVDGPGDRVLAEPGPAPYDPETGAALPDAGGSLLDAVADCGSSADQRGVARPQGRPATSAPSSWSSWIPSPPTTGTTPTAPPVSGPPAPPVVDAARFTG